MNLNPLRSLPTTLLLFVGIMVAVLAINFACSNSPDRLSLEEYLVAYCEISGPSEDAGQDNPTIGQWVRLLRRHSD